jgi:hypothetical protein
MKAFIVSSCKDPFLHGQCFFAKMSMVMQLEQNFSRAYKNLQRPKNCLTYCTDSGGFALAMAFNLFFFPG